MQIRKLDIVNRSAEELIISGITSRITSEESTSFIGRLDEMMASLSEEGYDLGYLYPAAYGGSCGTDDSGLELWMVRPIAILLADDISSSFGKYGAVSQMKISDAYDILANGTVEIEGGKYPHTLPVGSANEYHGRDSYFYYSGNHPREDY